MDIRLNGQVHDLGPPPDYLTLTEVNAQAVANRTEAALAALGLCFPKALPPHGVDYLGQIRPFGRQVFRALTELREEPYTPKEVTSAAFRALVYLQGIELKPLVVTTDDADPSKAQPAASTESAA